jgi:protein TonB
VRRRFSFALALLVVAVGSIFFLRSHERRPAEIHPPRQTGSPPGPTAEEESGFIWSVFQEDKHTRERRTRTVDAPRASVGKARGTLHNQTRSLPDQRVQTPPSRRQESVGGSNWSKRPEADRSNVWTKENSQERRVGRDSQASRPEAPLETRNESQRPPSGPGAVSSEGETAVEGNAPGETKEGTPTAEPRDEAQTSLANRTPSLKPPEPIDMETPQYPFRVLIRRGDLSPEAALQTPEGRARLRLLVRSDGTVGEVRILVSSGYPELDRAAAEALRRWHFLPATRDGVPIDAYYDIWVTFRVDGTSSGKGPYAA